MPYYFIWSGLVLKGTELTKMTYGVLETYQSFIKAKMDKDVLPHKHVISNYELVNEITISYQNALSSIDSESIKRIKRKLQEPNDKRLINKSLMN